MKAITLTQPWATLVAIGAKRIETRSWYTAHRGPLAIHAAKAFPDVLELRSYGEPFLFMLNKSGVWQEGEPFLDCRSLPTGCVVATCELVECFGIARGMKDDTGWGMPRGHWPLTKQERAFGDYSAGRYAWLLANVQPFVVPASARGALGLWNWDGAQ